MNRQTALVRGHEAQGAALPPPGTSHDGEPNRATIERLMVSFWNGRSPHTLAAYRSDIEQFCAYMVRACALDPNLPQLEILRHFFGASAGRANEIVLNYRADMKAVGKAPKTINRRLAAIRSLVKLGRLTGAIFWSIEVQGVGDELTRDTRGPDPTMVAQLIACAETQAAPAGVRNVAMLRLLFDLGLRVGELVHLDVADLELKTESIWILGKGRTRKQLLRMPSQTVEAIRAWLKLRGIRPGPLFLSYSRAQHRDGRLVSRGAYRIVRSIGAACGIHLHPHMLRHSAVTQAVEQSVRLGLSLDQVRDFSRHKSVAVLMTYRDRLTNQQATIARAVADSAKKDDDK